MSNPIENVGEMSDEEFLKIDPSKFEPPAKADASNADDDKNDDDSSDADDNQDDDSSDEKNLDDDSTPDDDDDNSDDKSDADDKAKADDKKDIKPDVTTDAQYAEIGKQVMAEFKANGTTIKVRSVEDAIQLMQMGANYHKKMAGLKPSLKTLKLLENNGLLDEAKLNYLIDLSQKKPEAITQLLKDSNIDPMTIDLKGEERYVPNARAVNDTELILDEVLESISSSPSYTKTLNVLGEQWDTNSRSAIAANPEIIRTINMHMESGIYDQVAAAVAYDRSMGKLVGVSDFDAYQRVGSYMHENNMFRANGQNNSNKQNQNDNSNAPQNQNDDKLKERLNRKQAASPSRQQKSPAKGDSNYNPLEMSDEDFIKLHKLNI